MSYCLTVRCGCVVYVSCHPDTGVAHTRIIQSLGEQCTVRRHEVGLRLSPCELLPDASCRPNVAKTNIETSAASIRRTG